MGTGIVSTYPHTIWEGSPQVTEVPSRWPVALDGHGYMVDMRAERWAHSSIAFLRPQQDDQPTFAESSLNSEGLVRRGQDSWHHGAGQAFRDRDGDDLRFNTSKGIDVWTPYQFSLLPDVDQKLSGSSTNYRLVVAGTRLYVADADSLKYTTDISGDSPSWTTVTGYTGGTILSLCSDGFTVYFTDGANIWTTNTGTSAASSTNTLNCDVIAWVKGRLMASDSGNVYNITSAGSAPSALFAIDILGSSFTWVGFAGGKQNIYMAGFAGDKSLIWKTSIKADGTSLDVPTVAGELPDGEIISGIGSYLGFIFLGTSKGVRFCEETELGLSIGSIVPTPTDVQCFEGQEEFVWYGLSDYDGSSTGLGRLNLLHFTEDPVTGGRKPAYASDLMAAGSGAVLSVVTFGDLRVFSVSGSGVWAEDTNKVASGTLSVGALDYGVPDRKSVLSCDVRNTPLAGSYSVSMSVDSATATTLGSMSAAGETSTSFPLESQGYRFDLTFTLTRDASDTTDGPTVTSWTLKASPGPFDAPAEYITLPLLLHSIIKLPTGEQLVDVAGERDHIKALRESQDVVVLQEPDQQYSVQVANYEWLPYALRTDVQTGEYTVPDGTLLVQLKRVS